MARVARQKPSKSFEDRTLNEILRFAVVPYFPRNNESAINELCRSFMAHCRTPENVTKAVSHFLDAEEPRLPTSFEVQQWAYNELIGKPRSERVAILRKETSGDPCKTCAGEGQFEKSGYVKVVDPETGEKVKSRWMTWVAFCPCKIGQALAEARKPQAVGATERR